MYGFSDHLKAIPRTALSAVRHGCSRYSVRTAASIEHVFVTEPLAHDVARVTFPLPTPPGHVHGYLLRDPDGWTLVDTGLALPNVESRFEELVTSLDAPVTRIVITHMHPDHLGSGEVAAAVTRAPVWQ